MDWAHTVAYVPKWAVSGAAIVSLGCDDIVMAPGANIGDAGAIILDEKSRFRFVPQKAISILASKMRSIGQSQGPTGGIGRGNGGIRTSRSFMSKI